MKTLFTLLTLTLLLPLASAQVKPFSIVHISDTHISVGTKSHDDNLKRAVDEFNAMDPRPAFIIHTGDITEMGQEDQFKLYEADMKGALMPVKNTCGNHETRWADQSVNRFVDHFGSSNISFKMNGVRFIGFNAAIWLEHHGAISGDTRRWIVSQLKQDPKGTPAILFCHQPPMYPDNVFITGDVELWDAIKPYNVIAFLNGHGHIFKSWTVNGVFCHMTKGMMNDQGGYTIYQFGTDEAKVYDKLNGEAPKLVATLPYHRPTVDVTVLQVVRRAPMTPPTFTATVASNGPKVERVEYLVDHHQRPDDKNWTRVDAAGPGRYQLALDTTGLDPGRHTLAVRAVDSDGGVWMKVLGLPVIGNEEAKVFNAVTALQGPAAVDAANAYVGGWDGKLYAVDRKTMKPKWTFSTGSAVIGKPDVDDHAVYFGSTDEYEYAVDRKSGKQIWKFKTEGPIQGHTLLANGTVYVCSGDHKVYAIDANTGRQQWAYTMDLHAQCKPAYADGKVIVGSWDGNVYALDAKTGEPIWTYQVSPSLFFAAAVSSPLVADGKVILTRSTAPKEENGPHVLALDVKTGKKVWGYHFPRSSPAYSTPTTDGKLVFTCGLNGELVALNLAEGTPVWTSPMGEEAYDCSPVYTNGQVICNTLMGKVEGHDAQTGAKLWSYKTGAGLSFAWPTIADGTVYQPSFDGTLTAITIPKG